MRRNKIEPGPTTHGGGQASRITPIQELRRTVLACLLWEDGFYEDGEAIGDRITGLVSRCEPIHVRDLAVQARTEFSLRHVPLQLVVAMLRTDKADYKKFVRETINQVVRRPDEMGELLTLYWGTTDRQKSDNKSIPASLRRGLADVFGTFDAYKMGKYNRRDGVKLRDVQRLVHPHPGDATSETARIAAAIANGTLESPDTWETQLSAGKDAKATWSRLITEGKLGGLALLRNLRNMHEAGVDRALIYRALATNEFRYVLPFRFIAAARACPILEPGIDDAFRRVLANWQYKLPGKTVVVIDVSGSMRGQLSARSDMTRLDAACALGAICRELCEDGRIYATAGNDYTRIHATQEIPARRGLPLVDSIADMMMPLGGGGIFLNQAMRDIEARERRADRVIVITDEQDCSWGVDDSPDKAPLIGRHNYILNVSTDQRGIGYRRWTHISGFSESVLTYIYMSELV